MNCQATTFDLDIPTTYPDCELCGEQTAEEDIAEMYDPTAPPIAPAVICHPDCGISRGYKVA